MSDRPRWEYREHWMEDDPLTEEARLVHDLDGLGRDGWEVVSVDWKALRQGRTGARILLKRPV